MIGSRRDKRAEWLAAQDRKRSMRAWAIALGAYAIGFAALWLAGLFAIQDVGAYAGPVMVRLGDPEGMDKPVPEPEQPQETQPPAPPPPIPEPAVAQAATAPSPAPKPQAQQPAVASQSAPTPPAPASPPAPVSPPSHTIKGSETGNSYDMTFEASVGTVSRGMYEPIYLYMPLPIEVPNALFQLIPDRGGLPGTAEQRKAEFKGLYELTGGTLWRLKGGRQPAYELRPAVWAMLEDAGYDIRNADYKMGRSLRPVEILFKVSVYKTSGGVRLEDVHLERSCGYGDIDDAVLYAFRKAGFTNSGDKSITGRFVYRFD